MTLIIGANCKDGIVLVADRKVVGSNRLVSKIRQPQNLNVIFTAGGYEGIFEDYLNDLTKNVDFAVRWIEEENKKNPIRTEYDFPRFKKTCIDTLTELKHTYRALGESTPFEQILQVFFTMPEQRGNNNIARLYKMKMDECFPQALEENEVQAIGYETLALPFLRSLDNGKDITMRDVARVATFTIKYLEDEELTDGAVGIGDLDPQIYFEAHGEDPREIMGEELKELLHGVYDEVTKMRKLMGSSSTFLRS